MRKQKILKKVIVLALTLLMLMSAVPLQSFAVLSLINPSIESIAFDEGVMISMKEIEMLHTYDDVIRLNSNPHGMNDEPQTGFYYENLIVTFSNGKTVELDKLFDVMPETIGYSGPYIEVSYEDCKNAIENGDDTVPVNVELTISFERGKNQSFEGKVDCKIVESYIKSIRPTGELNPYYEKMYYYDCFVGQEFLIEYADGTTKTAAVTEGEEYLGFIGPLVLDSRPIGIACDFRYGEFVDISDEVEFIYCDARYTGELTKIPSPYRRVDILDYTIEKNNVLTSITYEVKKINGEAQVYVKECNITDFDDTIIIDKLGAYRVEVDLNIDVATDKENSVGRVVICLGDGNNENSYRFYDYEEYDASDYCSCICHRKGISKIIYRLLYKIWDLFGINEQCKCGGWHWDE